ncbi:MAG: hypothetical protein A2V67_03005 [Deltaproteobacteria bacterium RBG_13_61_14]|nr:MAG: hypothetical protein A2V67_03005 [Deltaproteobacteria bacterium RBG_13_61_14]
MKIIDIHTHVGDLIYGQPLDEAYEEPVWTPAALMEWSGFRANQPPLGFRTLSRYLEIIHIHHRNNLGTEKNLRRFAALAGVTHAVLQPIEPFRSTEDNLALCRESQAAGSQSRPRLFTFASVNPRDPERLQKLERYLAQGCLGLKLHPIVQNLPLTDPAWFELVEAFRPYRQPVLIHSGKATYYIAHFQRTEYGDARTYEKLIAAFPEQPFILAHHNLGEPGVVWSLAKKYANVYADLSFQPASVIRRAFSEMGEDRVLYASDFPFTLPYYAVKVGMQATKGNDKLREKFFGQNAEALIGKLPEVSP